MEHVESKRILVAGKNSYIGCNFIEYINSLGGYDAQAISVRDDAWKRLDFSKYDVIYDVAGIAHIKETEDNRHLYYEVNRDLAVELAKKAKEEGVKQFIYLSSMSVFGLIEGHIDMNTPTNPVNAYGKSKLEAERQLMALSSKDFIVTIVRPPMVYGVGCKGNYQLLRKFALKVKAFPNVNNKRSMISIENMSKAVVGMIDHPKTYVYHPQDLEYIRTYDMVKKITKESGTRLLTIRGFNWLIKLMTKRINIFKKVFGSLTYDKEMNVPLEWLK